MAIIIPQIECNLYTLHGDKFALCQLLSHNARLWLIAIDLQRTLMSRPLRYLSSEMQYANRFETDPDNPRWEMTRLRNSGHLKYHLAYPKEGCGFVLMSAVEKGDPQESIFNKLPEALIEPSFKDPNFVFSFIVQNEIFPIDEILLVRYPQQVVGVIVFTRAGVHEQVVEAINRDWTGPFGDCRKTHYEDERYRLAMTITGKNDRKEQTRLHQFLDCIGDIAPFAPQMKMLMKSMIECPDDQLSVYDEFEIIKREKDPKYFGYPPTRVYVGGRTFFHPLKDSIIHTQIPAIIDAIFNSDLDSVIALVEADPTCVLQCDPWGREPIQIASECSQASIFQYLTLQRKALVHPNDTCQNNYEHSARNAEHIFKEGKQESKTAKCVENTALLFSLPLPPQRSPLHQACLDGDFALVQTLVNEGAPLESMDTYGMKPLLLAVANNHLVIAKFLIERGASLLNWEYMHKYRGNCAYRLLLHASTAPMIRLLLSHHVDEELAISEMGHALRAGNVELVEVYLFYVRHINIRRWGLRSLDIAIKHKDPQVRKALVLLITRYYENFVPEGPYDSTLDQETRTILESHNARYRQELLMRSERPQVTSMCLNTKRTKIKTFLTSKTETDVKVVSTTVRHVKESVQEACFQLFNMTFSMTQVHDTEEERRKYFSGYFHTRNKSAFVDLSYVRGELVGFLFYEFNSIPNTSVGPFTMFHAQLGCSVVNRLGLLVNLGFRAGLAAYSPKNRVLMYGECIWPGYGFAFFPKHFNGFPCYTIPTDVLKTVVESTKEHLDADKSISTKIQLQKQKRGHSEEYKLCKFQFFNSRRNQLRALPVAFFLDEESKGQFCDHMRDNGITERSLDEFKTLWSGLTMNTSL